MQSRQETERRPALLPHCRPRADHNGLQGMTREMCWQQEGPIRDNTRRLGGGELLDLEDL